MVPKGGHSVGADHCLQGASWGDNPSQLAAIPELGVGKLAERRGVGEGGGGGGGGGGARRWNGRTIYREGGKEEMRLSCVMTETDESTLKAANDRTKLPFCVKLS